MKKYLLGGAISLVFGFGAVSATAQHLQKSDPDIDSNTIVGFTPATGPDTWRWLPRSPRRRG